MGYCIINSSQQVVTSLLLYLILLEIFSVPVVAVALGPDPDQDADIVFNFRVLFTHQEM